MHANKITKNGEVLLDLTQDTATEADVAEGKTFHKADGSPATGTAVLGGGGAELNIAYGDTPPEDTSKLWVKTEKPSGVLVSTEKVFTEGGQEEAFNEFKVNLPWFNGCIACVGTNIYTFGGRSSGSTTGTTKIFRINAKTKTITTLSEVLPYGLVWPACASYGTKIYLFGGKSIDNVNNDTGVFYDSIIEFDTDTLEVVELDEKLPVQMYGACACCVNSKIYIFGGNDRSIKNNTDTILIFDPETKEVAAAYCTLPTASSEIACASVGDKIYLFGGNKTMTDILCYNTVDGSIELLSEKLPKGIINIGCSAVDDIICLMAGNGSSGTNISDPSYETWIFDTLTRKITESDYTITNAYMNCDAVTVEKRVYVVGNASGWIIEYTPKLGQQVLDAGTLQLYPTLEKNFFKFINTDAVKVDIGVDMVHKGNESNVSELVEAALFADGEWASI